MKIGGSGSSEFKGVLAHFLKTTIPTKIRTIYLCHACNDELCSNPEHLYWGTPKDNHQDKVECGRYKSIYQLMVEKHGVEETKRLMRERQLK